MGLVKTLRYRIRALFRKGRLDRETNDEMRFHIEMLAREYEADGMSEAQALRKAKMDFGGMEKMKETMREVRGVLWLENLWRDCLLGLRQLYGSPGFTTVAIVTLGIGIGACAAMFSVVNTVLLKPLPFEDPEELVWVMNNSTGGLSAQTTRVENFLEWRDANQVFDSMGGYNAFFDYHTYILSDKDGYNNERLRGVAITEGFLETLGVRPMLGRSFNADELVWNGPPVVILNHDFWKRRFEGDPRIVGETIIVDGRGLTVVGIMPSSFDFDSVFTPGVEVEMLLPLPLVEQTYRWGNTLAIVGRLKDGHNLHTAQANLEMISKRLNERVAVDASRNRHRVNTEMLDERIRGPYRTPFFVLLAAVACVLAIACVNIANLLIARSNGRKKEFAMRTAIGAKRGHLMRQSLVESILLSLGGLLVGLPLVWLSIDWIAGLKAFSIPLLQGVAVNGQSVAFVVVIAILTGIGCGLYPAIQASCRSPGEALGDGNERGSSSRKTAFLRKSLVATEVALSCLLLIVTGLLVRSFDKLIEVDPGFEPNEAMVWRIDGGMNFESTKEAAAFYRGLTESLAALPGVEAVGLSETLPMGRNYQWRVRRLDGEESELRRGAAFPRIVDNGYARAMGLKVIAGRFFSDLDTFDSEQGVVINEVLAKRLWDDEDPIGRMIKGGGMELRIIGVVSDVRHSGLDAEPSAEMYFSINQDMHVSALEMVIRSKLDKSQLVSAVRRRLSEYHSALPKDDYRTLRSIVDHSLAPMRLIKNLLAVFSLTAIVLAGVGLYGVISYSVGQRLKEFGIRMAIGSSARQIMRLVLKEGILVTGVGVVIGLIVAFAFSRFLTGMLYGVNATDPAIFGINVLIVGAIAILASLLPVRFALRKDPVRSLRAD